MVVGFVIVVIAVEVFLLATLEQHRVSDLVPGMTNPGSALLGRGWRAPTPTVESLVLGPRPPRTREPSLGVHVLRGILPHAPGSSVRLSRDLCTLDVLLTYPGRTTDLLPFPKK